MKIAKILLSVVVFLTMFNTVVYAANIETNEEVNGDLTIEEGAAPYAPTSEERIIINQKIVQAKAMERTRGVIQCYKELAVSTFEQETSYYCGPATVKQTIDFHKGSSPSQSELAKQLGTTTDGTDMTKIAGVVNSNASTNYSMVDIGSESLTTWENLVINAVNANIPPIIDINSKDVPKWLYTTSGHFLNISGFDSITGIHNCRVTDPWKEGLGDHWYSVSSVWEANKNHFRHSIIL